MDKIEKKKKVFEKFYGGNRKPYHHDFSIEDGICKHCGTFIGDAKMRMCKIITPDEVALFIVEDEQLDIIWEGS